MFFDNLLTNLDLVATVVFISCLVLIVFSDRDARTHRKIQSAKPETNDKYGHLFVHEERLKEAEQFQTSKGLRKAYRKNWVEKTLATKNYAEARENVRNLIMTNTAFISAVLISFGLFVSGFSFLEQSGGSLSVVKLITISSLLIYALFMLISESRVLNYVPIVFLVDEEIIDKLQAEDKATYIASLLDSAFDSFSFSIRAIFYAVICIFWFFNTPIFILGTVILTIVIIRSDLDKRAILSIF